MKYENSTFLNFLYNTVLGRLFLKILTARSFSKIVGHFLDTPLSKPLIRPFVKKANIDLTQYETVNYRCFNDCFTRKILPNLRPIDLEPTHFIAPCDGLLSVFAVQDGTVLNVKNSSYTIQELLQNKALADRYQNGYCFVFRLCVEHYHRYCYVDSGEKSENCFIPGLLHTVRPIATKAVPVFTENCREYTLIQSKNFGLLLQMEVGAMLVGKIQNYHGRGTAIRGEEKGMFLYGGSTVIVLMEKNKISPPQALLENTANGLETPVKMGEQLAISFIKTLQF